MAYALAHKISFVCFNLFWPKNWKFSCLFVTEEILYSIECWQTMAHYCTHLCQQQKILHSITAVVQSRELGQAPILLSLTLRQVLSSHPLQQMVHRRTYIQWLWPQFKIEFVASNYNFQTKLENAQSLFSNMQ